MVKYPLAILVLSRGSYFTYMHIILKWEIFSPKMFPPYDKSSNPYDSVFVQPSISQAHFFQSSPLLPHFLMEIPLNYLNLRMMQKTSIQMY